MVSQENLTQPLAVNPQSTSIIMKGNFQILFMKQAMPKPDKNSTHTHKCNYTRKTSRAIWITKEIENLRESMIKLTQWKIHKLARYKINMQNSITCIIT